MPPQQRLFHIRGPLARQNKAMSIQCQPQVAGSALSPGPGLSRQPPLMKASEAVGGCRGGVLLGEGQPSGCAVEIVMVLKLGRPRGSSRYSV